MSLLNDIQKNLKAPKSRTNNFGKYKYRSCEDILEAIKPLLGASGELIVSDDLVVLGDRFYIKATATLKDGEHSWSACGFARESLDKKGMDDSQITGTASSYARKYALNGLFLIDDTKDADTDEHHQETTQKPKKAEPKKEPITEDRYNKALLLIKSGKYTKEELIKKFDVDPVKVEQDLTNLKGE